MIKIINSKNMRQPIRVEQAINLGAMNKYNSFILEKNVSLITVVKVNPYRADFCNFCEVW